VHFSSLVGGGRGTDLSSLPSLVWSCSFLFLWSPKTTLKKPAKKGPSRSTSRVLLLSALCTVILEEIEI
ncbi:unnamed protein product, partial [Musa hybrid cultivar]